MKSKILDFLMRCWMIGNLAMMIYYPFPWSLIPAALLFLTGLISLLTWKR